LRVSLDTNVLVSAFTTRGICADVLAVVLAEHQLVLGEKVLAELRRVLQEKMKMPEDDVTDAEAFLRQEAAEVSKGSGVRADIRDPDDAEMLAQAIEGLAEVLVTGDRDLLDVTVELPVEVLSPRGFWEKLHEPS
jgi:putative PIN family toxin of toxin-antitoxin system